jgi:hypothetical protein
MSRWGRLGEALDLVDGNSPEIEDAIRAGDIPFRLRRRDRTAFRCEISRLGEIDWTHSRVAVEETQAFFVGPGAPPLPPSQFDWYPAEVDLDAVAACFPSKRVEPAPQRETRGRREKWPWQRAMAATVGRIYRGEVPEPTTQARVEELMADWFIANCDGEQPAESQIRDHASLIWREIEKA